MRRFAGRALTREQIVGFHWKPEQQRDFVADVDRRAASTARRSTAARSSRRRDDAPMPCSSAEAGRGRRRLSTRSASYGDLVIAAFFAADNDRKRKTSWIELLRRARRPSAASATSSVTAARRCVARAFATGRQPDSSVSLGDRVPGGVRPRESGVRCIVGNPPFVGRNTISTRHGDGYLDWLKTIHDESHGNADLVAHFFRRAFDLLRDRGTLRPDRHQHDCPGRHAIDRPALDLQPRRDDLSTPRGGYKWPGQAAVVVSVVHVCQGAAIEARIVLDGDRYSLITAYLVPRGGHDDPDAALQANAGKSFHGQQIVLGMGFTFDDTDTERRRHADRRDARLDRQGSAERRADLSLHRRRGGQRQPDACPSSVRHQLWRDDRGRGATSGRT